MRRLILTFFFFVAAASASKHEQNLFVYPFFPTYYDDDTYNYNYGDIKANVEDCGSKGYIFAIRARGCPDFPCKIKLGSVVTVEVDFRAKKFHPDILLRVSIETPDYQIILTYSELLQSSIAKNETLTIHFPLIASSEFGTGPVTIKGELADSEGDVELCGKAKIIIVADEYSYDGDNNYLYKYDGEKHDGDRYDGGKHDGDRYDGEKHDDDKYDGEKHDDDKYDGEKGKGSKYDGKKGKGHKYDEKKDDGEDDDEKKDDGKKDDGKKDDGETY